MEMELTNISVTAGDSDAETPPRSVKEIGFSSYRNGGFKRRHCVTAPPPPAVVVSYRECMRNHAAGIGGHALDGCCEFMPSEETDSGSLRCAACGCHRNFHRRDPDDPAPLQLHCHRGPPPESAPAATRSFYSGHHVSLKKTFSGSAPATISPVSGGRGGGKKRFRTRFSQEQKEKMYEFAEKLGWKLQRIDKRLIEEFCSEIGVGKEVLKVWMHNNKNTLGRREISGGNVNGGIIDGEYNIAAADLVTKSLAGIGNGGPHNGDHFKPVVKGRSGNGSSSSSG